MDNSREQNRRKGRGKAEERENFKVLERNTAKLASREFLRETTVLPRKRQIIATTNHAERCGFFLYIR